MSRIFTLLFALMFGTLASAQTFTSLNSGVQSDLTKIQFITEDLGYCVGYQGTILKTMNGGMNWLNQTSGTSSDLTGLYFQSIDTGYVIGDNGTLLNTYDGGSTWNNIATNENADLRRVIKNGNELFISGTLGIFKKSSDEGQSWTTINLGTSETLYSMWFTNASTGFLVGNEGLVFKTIDSGNSWSELGNFINSRFLNIQFQNQNNGIIVGGNSAVNNGVIAQTSDGGATWTASTDIGAFYASADFFDINTGYIVGGDIVAGTSIILTTSDGGQTWDLVPSNFDRQIGLSIVGNSIYSCGLNGSILKASIPVSVAEQSHVNSLEIFPNPTEGIIQVNLPTVFRETSFSIELYDAIGRRVIWKENVSLLDISNQAKGLYTLKMYNKNNIYQAKIVLE